MIPIKKLDFWVNNNLNVLLVGSHGIGKTSIIESAFSRHDVKWKYFSAATMDPWVDFIGVPKEKIEDGVSYLDLIRPKEFANDEIEFIFFDEFNRAPSKVRNAVMELIQFKSINGRKFNNLRGIWAAINPHDDESTYDVERLDPAQEDRFHVRYELPIVPDQDYFINKYGSEVGIRAVAWWNSLVDSVKPLVSPRRLDLATDLILKGGDPNDYLDHQVRPKTLKSAIMFTTKKQGKTLSPVELWKQDPDGYFFDITTKLSKKSFAQQFAGSLQISEDLASTYVKKCDQTQLQILCTDDNTVGIVAKSLQTLNTKQHNAVIKHMLNLAPNTFWDDQIASHMSSNDEPYVKLLCKLNGAPHNINNWNNLLTCLRSTTNENLTKEDFIATYYAISQRLNKIKTLKNTTAKIDSTLFLTVLKQLLMELFDKIGDKTIYGHFVNFSTEPMTALLPPVKGTNK